MEFVIGLVVGATAMFVLKDKLVAFVNKKLGK